MRRRWLLLLEFMYEVVRLVPVLGLAALVLNREGYSDVGMLLFLVAIPALIFPSGVLLLYLDWVNDSLRKLLIIGKGLMVLTEALFLLLISLLGLIVAPLFSFSYSQQLPLATGGVLLLLFGFDLLFFALLILLKPTRAPEPVEGIPEPPVVRLKEE